MKNIILTILLCMIFGNIMAQTRPGANITSASGSSTKGGVTKDDKLLGSRSRNLPMVYTYKQQIERQNKLNFNKSTDELLKDVSFQRLSVEDKDVAYRISRQKGGVASKRSINETSTTSEYSKTLPDGTVRKISKVKDEDVYPKTINQVSSDSVASDKTTFSCVSSLVSLKAGYSENLLTNPNSHFLYLGSLLDAKGIVNNGSYNSIQINAKINPLEYSLENFGTFNGSVSDKIQPNIYGVIGKADYLNSLNKLLYNANQANATNAQYSSMTVSEMNSSSEFKAKLGFGIGNDTDATFFKIDAEANRKKGKNTILAICNNSYYTTSISGQDIVNLFSTGTIIPDEALIVSSITYGRIIMFRIETELTEDSISVAMNASFNGKDGNASASLLTKLNSSKFELLVIGGGANEYPSFQEINLKQLLTFFNKPVLWSASNPGVPISYTLSFLNDGRISNTHITTKFYNRDCQIVGPKKVEFSLDWIKPSQNGLDLCGKITTKATFTNSRGIVEVINPISGKENIFDCKCDKNSWYKNISNKENFIITGIKNNYVFTKEQVKTGNIEVIFELKDGLQDVENTFDVTGRNAIPYMTQKMNIPLASIKEISEESMKTNGNMILNESGGKGRIQLFFNQKVDTN